MRIGFDLLYLLLMVAGIVLSIYGAHSLWGSDGGTLVAGLIAFYMARQNMERW